MKMGAACVLTSLAWCMGLFDAHGPGPGEQMFLVSPMMVALTQCNLRLCMS